MSFIQEVPAPPITPKTLGKAHNNQAIWRVKSLDPKVINMSILSLFIF